MNKKENWFLSLLSFAKKDKAMFIFSIFLSVCSIVSGLVPFFCIYKIIDFYTAGTLSSILIVRYCALALLFFAIKVLLFALSTKISHALAFSVIGSLRKQIAKRFLHAPLGEVQKYSIGEIKAILVDKTQNIEPPLAHVVPEGAGHIILPIVSIIALFLIDYRIALSSLITLPIAVICMALTFIISGKNFSKYNESNQKMSSMIVEYIEGIQVIKAFGKSGVSYEKYASSIKDYKTFVLKWMQSTWVTMKMAFAFFPSTILGTLPISLYLASNNIITPSQVFLSVMLSISMVSSLAKLEVFSESLRQMKETIMEVNSYLCIPVLSENEEKDIEIKNYDVQINNVSFGYSKDKQVFEYLSLTLKEGSFTALVGPSGSGKSTVAKLLSRFYDVDNGEITIGGVNIKNMKLSKLSSLISYVTQDNYLFDTSIKENIRMGKPDATDQEVKIAAKKGCCEEFIEKLTDGYETTAGEAGKRLSGGEKQRIAIARMIIKDSPLVILDEATAFTDPENEDRIQQSIKSLTQSENGKKGKTLLVIAHRLSTIKNADNIIVMDEGKIVDMGTHEKLLNSCSLYKNMWISHTYSEKWAVGSKNKLDDDNSVTNKTGDE